MGAVSEIPSEWLAEFEAATRRRSTADGVRKTFPIGSAMAAFEYRQAQEIRDTFARHEVR
jgi:hypothetical protein